MSWEAAISGVQRNKGGEVGNWRFLVRGAGTGTTILDVLHGFKGTAVRVPPHTRTNALPVFTGLGEWRLFAH